MMFGNLKICKLHCHCVYGNVIEDDSPKFPITPYQTNFYFKLNTMEIPKPTKLRFLAHTNTYHEVKTPQGYYTIGRCSLMDGFSNEVMFNA